MTTTYCRALLIFAATLWPAAASLRAAESAVDAATGSNSEEVRNEEVSPQALAHFENHVRPVLVEHCIKCHGPKKAESGLRLDRRATALAGGDSGPAVVPGQPDKSLLLAAVRHRDDLEMPPDGKLDARAVDAIERWIEDGAAWPDGAQLAGDGLVIRSGPITDEERAFWSFQPIDAVEPPTVDASLSVHNDVDRFIHARLAAEGLAMRKPADKRTLLRRATFDLTGLPPTPDEVAVFLADESPQAFANVVDRLLASQAYGERWGRHWLDVVRYADTAGETADYPTPLAYKYRNWVIRAFNADMPYDEFVRQQIAGDVMGQELLERAGDSPHDALLEEYRDMLTATGFIAISRRFGFDVENYHHLTIQDTIDVTGQAMLGLTLGCARCHDHKFDPVNMEDYYAWYGIFESTRYSFPGSEEKKRPYDLFPVVPAKLAADGSGANAASGEVIYGAIDGDQPADARMQMRGEKTRPGDVAPRRNLAILGGDALPASAGSGRWQLAQWLTRPTNPLTARVMVNRIWQQHFGHGLVSTENDFGVRGQRPSHPRLLDWLARRFIDGGWSIKSMHRTIMASAAYRQASDFDAHAAQRDPDARLLWRFNRRRLSAEEIRDAMLRVSGDLDPSMGGAHPFPPVDSWGFTQHTPYYGVYATNRRSVYLMQQRLKRHPFLGLFDGADGNVSVGHRELTTVPTQALFLMNNPFVHERAESLARRFLATMLLATPRPTNERTDEGVEGRIEERIGELFVVALGRPATEGETAEAREFVAAYRSSLANRRDVVKTEHEAQLAGWSAFIRTLLVRNEFLYVD